MKMLRTKEVAKRLNMSDRTVRNMIKRGSFPGARKMDPNARSIYLIPEIDVERIERGECK